MVDNIRVLNGPTHQRQAVEEKEGKHYHGASQNDNLCRFDDESHHNGCDTDEPSVHQTPGEPSTQQDIAFSILSTLIYSANDL